jgi:hypothetical protein
MAEVSEEWMRRLGLIDACRSSRSRGVACSPKTIDAELRRPVIR